MLLRSMHECGRTCTISQSLCACYTCSYGDEGIKSIYTLGADKTNLNREFFWLTLKIMGKICILDSCLPIIALLLQLLPRVHLVKSVMMPYEWHRVFEPAAGGPTFLHLSCGTTVSSLSVTYWLDLNLQLREA